MGIRGGAQPRHAQNAAQRHLGAPYSAVSFFYILSGPNYPEGLSGNTLAEHTMQQPGREQATSKCPGGLYNDLNTCFYLKSRSLPLEGDMSNNPISCLSHYLYRSAFIAALFNKQYIAPIYYCIHLFLYKYVQS